MKKITNIEEIINRIRANPDDFRVLERIPYTLYDENTPMPVNIAPIEADAVPLIILDVETTGLDYTTEKIIELAMIKVYYSPSANKILQIVDILDQYEDPQFPIPENITELTGITNEMVYQKSFDNQQIASYVSSFRGAKGEMPIIISHNASFDRKFIEKRFPFFSKLQWGCSIKDAIWHDLGFSSCKQEQIAVKLGYFYEAHRAATDCLALTFILNQQLECLQALYKNVFKNIYTVVLHGNTYDIKETLKTIGFKWNSNERFWYTVVKEDKKKQLTDQLVSLGMAISNIEFTEVTSYDRYSVRSAV